MDVPYPHISSFSNNLHEWLKAKCQSLTVHKSKVPWNILFSFAVQGLWKPKNMVVFENTTLNPKLHNGCISQAPEYHFCVGKIRQLKRKVAIPIRWNKPLEGWYKLNTDEASFCNPRKAGKHYQRQRGPLGERIFEIHRLHLQHYGRIMGFERWTEVGQSTRDPKVIIDLINSNANYNRAYSPLLHDCRLLLSRFPQVRVAHVFRKANICVNALTKRGCSSQEDFVAFDTPPG